MGVVTKKARKPLDIWPTKVPAYWSWEFESAVFDMLKLSMEGHPLSTLEARRILESYLGYENGCKYSGSVLTCMEAFCCMGPQVRIQNMWWGTWLFDASYCKELRTFTSRDGRMSIQKLVDRPL